jgi:hypothetical protein
MINSWEWRVRALEAGTDLYCVAIRAARRSHHDPAGKPLAATSALRSGSLIGGGGMTVVTVTITERLGARQNPGADGDGHFAWIRFAGAEIQRR